MRKRRPRTPTLGELDELIQLADSIRECEEKLGERRGEMIKTGQSGLARQFLNTPAELRELAGCLWYGRPAVFTEQTMMIPSRPSKSRIRCEVKSLPINGRSPRKFELVRSDESETRPLTKSRADAIASRFDAVKPMIAAKAKSDFLDATRKRGETINKPKIIRELAIKIAPWSYPLEEWATIFPDAALAKDYDFIKRIVDQFVEPPVYDICYWAIAFSWDGFECFGLPNQVPPLKHWRDKAACEYVSWKIGESISIDAYRRPRKSWGDARRNQN